MILEKVRLDKWLWAARFYRTRAKAKDAVDGGKVHIKGTRAKPSKEIVLGDEIEVHQGSDKKTVVVTGLSGSRRGASEAKLLYEETEHSVTQREEIAALRKAAGQHIAPPKRPTKKGRRLIHKFREQSYE